MNFPQTRHSDITEKFEKLRKSRWKVSRSTADERVAKLKKLKAAILSHEQHIQSALEKDFRKAPTETLITEILPALDELSCAIKKTAQWMKPQRVGTPISLFGARSFLQYESKGVVLILSPWNYPFYLAIAFLVAAISAGNCAILKASEKTPHTTEILRKIIADTFSDQEVTTCEGGVDIAEALLTLPFDHIFFTGSTPVGKKVMAAASHHLTTVTLELGGKSPTIVHEDADLEDAAKKITWGKFINMGQTCVAPDFVYVHEKIADQFSKQIQVELQKSYGKNLKSSPDLARLIDQKSFFRLNQLSQGSVSQGAKLAVETETDAQQNYLSPTVLTDVTWQQPIMSEEIFGPILPILKYRQIDEVIQKLQEMEKPLAMYLFSNDSEVQERIMKETTSGGLVINHVILHLANHNLPFGGVGPSGMGSYHGHFGFKTFSHERAVLKQSPLTLSTWLFPPYNGLKAQWALKLMRFLFG